MRKGLISLKNAIMIHSKNKNISQLEQSINNSYKSLFNKKDDFLNLVENNNGNFEIEILGNRFDTNKISYIKKTWLDIRIAVDRDLKHLFDDGRWKEFKIEDVAFDDSSYICFNLKSAVYISNYIYSIIRDVWGVKYISQTTDCDNFMEMASVVLTLIIYRLGIEGVGAGIGMCKINYGEGKKGHALNLLPIWEGNDLLIKFYEPQQQNGIKSIDRYVVGEREDVKIFYIDF